MRLTVLGCAGTFPGPDSPCSSYLVESDGFRLLVDAGNGAVGALQRHVGLHDVDAVYLSHLHADHCIDLVAYSYARRLHPDGPAPVIPVYGPPRTQDRLCDAFEQRPDDGLTGVYEFRDTASGQTAIGPFEVRLARMAHPVECYAIRLTAGGRTLAYSGDTGPTDALARVARDADVLLCEASFRAGADNPPDLHMTGVDAGEHAAGAGVGRLLLTHLVAWNDVEQTRAEAAGAFDGRLEVARAGATYEI